ncbi:hypothetical protein WCX49_01125 [Sulfurimonas sp. HSL-1656]|uniref:hypothetical protein n=1 Tax=Thiomicrolovo subterrani TaxID=3131934 RepID=UPI0031F888EE
MKQRHPSTAKLLERALAYLVEIDHEDGVTIELNGKTYSHINFSAQQVIDCMHELALPGEVPLNSRSSFRRDKSGDKNQYMRMIERAESRRIARQAKKNGLTMSPAQQLDMAQLQMENIALRKENNLLRGSVAALESFISQAELRAGVEDAKPMIGRSENSYKDRYAVILKELLLSLFNQGTLMVTPGKGKMPAAINLDMLYGTMKLCNLVDVEELVDINIDEKGQIGIKAKK